MLRIVVTLVLASLLECTQARQHLAVHSFLHGLDASRQDTARTVLASTSTHSSTPQAFTSRYNSNNARLLLSSNATNPTVNVLAFGADPTGQSDSTAAIQAAVAQFLLMGSKHSLSNGIVDLGGAVLDLAGGDYLISSPLAIPQYYGNFRIQQGTLRASPTFPANDYLVTIGGGDCNNSQGSCNENVGLTEVMLDCQQVCAGGLAIYTTMGANVGPQMFFLGFTQNGINVQGK
jgi:hypothetical protein